MRSTSKMSIMVLACIGLAGCGGSSSDPADDSLDFESEEARTIEGPSEEQIESASAAAANAQQIANDSDMAGAMTATVEGQEKTFYIAGDSNLIDWNEADDGTTRVEIIGSPVANDWVWKDSMELTFNVSGSSVSDPQLIFRSMGSTDFHRTTSGQIVVSNVKIEGDQLTVAGSFSGTLTYQSFKDIPLEGYPQEITIDDGAFYASFAN